MTAGSHGGGPQKADELDSLVKIYSLLVEMSDRVSQRRQAANSFYLSVNTAIISAAAVLSSGVLGKTYWALNAAGILICAFWVRSILSYRTLNAAKFEVIQELEKRLPAKPYTDEWALLDPKGRGKRHKAFHQIEVRVPFVFLAVHAVQLCYATPWSPIVKIVRTRLGV